MAPRADGQPALTGTPAPERERDSTSDSIAVRAMVYMLVAFDVAQAIDLDAAERRVATAHREGLGPGKRTPPYLDYRPLPVRVTGSTPEIEVRGPGERARAWKTQPTFGAMIFDFGAVSVTHRVSFEGTLGELLALSEALYENKAVIEASRRVLQTITDTIQEAVTRPAIADPMEGYVVFQTDDPHLVELIGERRAETDALLAAILRSERIKLSGEEIADALVSRISYGERDVALIDWNAAIVVDAGETSVPGGGGAPGSGGDDVRFVLEYANVELLEMRVLDDRLDQILDDSYRLMSERRTRRLAAGWRTVNRLARLQMDSALLYEGVNNAIKLVGDQYLARVYRLAANRFHLPERDSTIERKLSTLESIYSKLQDQRSALRMEILEWIVIILIFMELVIPFLLTRGK